MFLGTIMHPLLRNMLAEASHHERLNSVEAARRLSQSHVGLVQRVVARVRALRQPLHTIPTAPTRACYGL